MSILIDLLLAVLAIYLALQSLLAPRLTKSVFLFFTFGLAIALAWVRLRAIDLAIAEAAIASGFLGVLLLDALRDFSPTFSQKQKEREVLKKAQIKKEARTLMIPRIGLGLGLGLFLLIALEAVWKIPDGGGLTQITEARLSESGVEHPVTAVLLNFRAYDTWMEIGVILMALLAVFATGGIKLYRQPMVVAEDLLLRQVILFFVPVLFLFGAFLLYFGKSGPGGAFQAGVLWGAIGILLQLGGRSVFTMIPKWLTLLFLTLGPLFFLLLGFALIATRGAFFEYPPAYAGFLILMVETLASISIAVTLTAIYANLNQMQEEPASTEPIN